MKDIVIDPKLAKEQIKEKSVGFIKEFKEFAVKGNAIDMAVGIVIGAAFGKIVSSIVSDIVMPVATKLTGNVNFADMFFVMGDGQFKTLADAKAAGAATVNYGMFINSIIDFIIIALSIFIAVRALNRLRRNEPPAQPPPPPPPPPVSQDIQLLTEIRDLLKKN